MQIYIYCLKDSENKIRYVGKTTNIKRRLYSHIYESKNNKGRRHVLNWINSLLKNNLVPKIEVIEVCNLENWVEREKYWIKYYRNLVNNLCNISDGGLGGTGSKNFTREEIEKKRQIMSKTMSRYDDITKQKIYHLIINGLSYLEIQQLFSDFSQQMYSGIKNGRQWRSITNITPKITNRKIRGYTCQKGLYLIRRRIDNKLKTIFSSRDEDEVKKYLLEMDR